MPAQGRPESETFQTSPLNTEVTLPILTDVNNGPAALPTWQKSAPPDPNPITRTEHMQATEPSAYVYSREDLFHDLAGEYAHRAHRDDMNVADLSVKLAAFRRDGHNVPAEIQADNALLADLIAWIDENAACAECGEKDLLDVLEGCAVYCSAECCDKGEFSPPDGEGYDWGCP